MIRRNKSNALVLLLLLAFHALQAQVVSPFNKLALKDTAKDYSFIVSGHFHGASTNISTFPASSLQANIDTLNKLKPLFLMSLGDMFLDVNQSYLDHYQKSLFDKLSMPLFNAVGNHDLSNGNMYEKVFGDSWFAFKAGTETFIVLNTEKDDGNIKSDQLIFFTDVLKMSAASKNIFIFSHRPVWAENSERYKGLFADNTRTMFGKNNFEEVLRPLLATYAKEKKIYWISGSMGNGPASFFYDEEPGTNITFIQTAIRDQPRDAALQVKISGGNVSFAGISFTGQQLNAIESYGMDYWAKTKPADEKFSFRLLPYLTLKMISHQYFWIGFAFAILIVIVVMLLRKRWKRKK